VVLYESKNSAHIITRSFLVLSYQLQLGVQTFLFTLDSVWLNFFLYVSFTQNRTKQANALVQNYWNLGNHAIHFHAPLHPPPDPVFSRMHPFQITTSLTPSSRVLLEKLISSQLIKKFPAFYGTRRFITAFTSAGRLSLS
jgi:hypothetical protein